MRRPPEETDVTAPEVPENTTLRLPRGIDTLMCWQGGGARVTPLVSPFASVDQPPGPEKVLS